MATAEEDSKEHLEKRRQQMYRRKMEAAARNRAEDGEEWSVTACVPPTGNKMCLW